MINKIYLNPGHASKIKKIFHANKLLPNIKLAKFLDVAFYAALRKEAINAKYSQLNEPMKYRYSEAKTPKILDKFLDSKKFKDFVFKITGKKIRKVNGNLWSFGWKDYTMLRDKKIEKPGFDLIIDFTDLWNEDAKGFVVYVDETGQHNKLFSIGTILTIVQRNKNVKRYAQYVNNLAGKNRRYFYFGTF